MSEHWEELEEPVLRWVLADGETTGELAYGSNQPFAGIPQLTEEQVAQAVKRLIEHGLVVAGAHTATNSYERWRELRPSADGLRVLGEWPPAEGAALNQALAAILRALAETDGVSAEEKTAARRAAGSVSQMAGDVVLDVAREEMKRLAGGT